MTDTTSAAPSDAEIEALAAEHLKSFAQFSGAGDVWVEGEVAFARAVLARWGAPQPVAGEPDAYLHDDGYWTAAKTDAGRNLNDRLLFAGSPKVAVYTTPQPTQAQAGAVPLTDEQIKDEASYHGFIGSTDQLVKFVRGIEAAHGIGIGIGNGEHHE